MQNLCRATSKKGNAIVDLSADEDVSKHGSCLLYEIYLLHALTLWIHDRVYKINMKINIKFEKFIFPYNMFQRDQFSLSDT